MTPSGFNPEENKRRKGGFGEQMALEMLLKTGMKLLEKNFRCRLGEVDLILRDKETLVFVEVKLRKNTSHGIAAQAVNFAKQKKIIRVAQYYLQRSGLKNPFVRFDVVGVEKMPSGEWNCIHYRHAFLSSR